ncbi:MAG TPA: hypothetical protein VEC16_01055 [Alphaproteobacteria bacterium]|nr:hypothetical protein [Alphaproteobacteria bacterium]
MTLAIIPKQEKEYSPFEKAKFFADSQFRKDYISELNWANYLPFVEEIYYYSSKKQQNLMTKIYQQDSEIVGSHLYIKIFPAAFDYDFIEKEEDFLHNLYNYVGYVAKERKIMSFGKFPEIYPYWALRYRKDLDESDAFLHSIAGYHRSLNYALSTLSEKNSEKYIEYLSGNQERLEDFIEHNLQKKRIRKHLSFNPPLFVDPIYSP